MENASLILAATIWRLFSYVLRIGVLGLSVIYGQESKAYLICLMISVVLLSVLVIFTLSISESNAMGKPAYPSLLSTCNILDNFLWMSVLITLGVGLFNVTLS